MAAPKRLCRSPCSLKQNHDDDVIFFGEVIRVKPADHHPSASHSEDDKNVDKNPIFISTPADKKSETPDPPLPSTLEFRMGGAVVCADFSHCLNHAGPSSPRKPTEKADFSIDTILALLFQPEHLDCPGTCMCKISSRRARGPIKEIIDHKWHGGRLFLLCKHHSPKACPEHLRLCQVNFVLREQYGNYLKKFGRPPPAKEKWTAHHEMAVRTSLYPELSADQTRVQEDLRHCEDTVEWEKHSGNGKTGIKSSPVPHVKARARPGPVIKTKEQAFFEVEQIVASSLEKGKRWYLVKWLGYPPSECTWEPEEGLQMSSDAIEKFNIKYGDPTIAEPIRYSPDGQKFAKACARRS